MAVVTSFFGMNVPLPLLDEATALYYLGLECELVDYPVITTKENAKKRVKEKARMAIENYARFCCRNGL